MTLIDKLVGLVTANPNKLEVLTGGPGHPWSDLNRAQLAASARKESPPGIYALWLGALDTVLTKDSSHVARAAELTVRSVPQDKAKYIVGLAYCDSGSYEQGLPLVEEAVSKSPHKESVQVLASRYLRAGRHEDAMAAYDSLLSKSKTDIETWYGKSQAALEGHRYAVLEDCCRKVISLSGRHKWAYLDLAIVEFKRYRPEVAAKALGRARRPPREFQSMFCGLQAHSLLWQGKYDQAGRMAEKALCLDPENYVARNVLDEMNGNAEYGIALYEECRFREALRWLRYEASRERASAETKLFLLISEAISSGDTAPLRKADRELGETVAEDVMCREVGWAEWVLGDAEEGIRRLRRAASLVPSPCNRRALAAALVSAGQPKEATDIVSRVMADQSPPDPVDYRVLMKAEPDPAERPRLARRAKEMRLSEGNCAEWLGDALLENGQIEDAIKEYRESIESDTEHVGGAWLGLAECYAVLGDPPKAREYATEALWHEPSCERARQIVAE